MSTAPAYARDRNQAVVAVLTLGMVCLFSAASSSAPDNALEDARMEPHGLTAISLPEQPYRTLDFAAGELAAYFKAMTGRDYTIVHESRCGNSALVRLGLDDALSEDGYRIHLDVRTIHIRGGSPRGCLYGAYALLGALGCRFPLPGKEHEVVPKRDTISWTCPPIRSEPAIGRRGIMWAVHTWGDDLISVIDFLAKNRFNSIIIHSGSMPEDVIAKLKEALAARDMAFEWGGHYLPGYLPRDLFQEHPEYFRMENGARTPNLNMCPSSAEAADVIAENSKRDWVKLCSIPRFEMLHIWPDDLMGGGWCSCNKCAGLTASDQAVKIVNEVARRLALPEGTAVAHASYHATIEAPKTIRPNEKVRLFYAPRERCYRHAINECETNQRYLAWLKGQVNWFPNDPEVMEYYLDGVLFRQMPMPLHLIIGRDVKAYREAGIDRIASLAFQTFSDWAYGPNYYVLGKALWRGEGDPRDIKEYCEAEYGPAAGAMERYFDQVFELCATAIETCGYPGFADMRWPPDHPFMQTQMAQLAPLVSEGHLNEIETILKDAETTAQEPYTTRIAQQLILWKITRLESQGIYQSMLSMTKAKGVLEGKGTETERAETIAVTKQAIANITEAAELLLTDENRKLGGPHVFREGGMVGGEHLLGYPAPLIARLKQLEESAASKKQP